MEAKPRDVRDPVFDAPNVLWYFGALVATFACLVLFGSVPGGARGLWVLLVAIAFAAVYWLAAAWLLQRGEVIPGGVIATWAVAFVAVGGNAFERLVGSSHVNQPSVSFVEAGASSPPSQTTFQAHELVLALLVVGAGLAVYAWTRFAFALAPVAGGALVSAELLVPIVLKRPSTSETATTLIVFAIALLVTGILLDLRSHRREAFWFHLFGLNALASGLAVHAIGHSSWGWILILVAGLVILALAAPLRRATWTIFGIGGVYVPLAYYAAKWFGTAGTAAALAVVGFGLVALGIAFRESEGTWAALGGRPSPPSAPAAPAG